MESRILSQPEHPFRFKKVFPDAQAPEKPKTWTDSGYDVRVHNFKAAYVRGQQYQGHEILVEADKDGVLMGLGSADTITLNPGERALIGTGIAMAVDTGWEVQVRNRSGLPWKEGLQVLNSPGTVDSGYRGEISIILGNIGLTAKTIRKGDRIAQLVIAPVLLAALQEVDSLDDTQRGDAGFGSTGKS